MAKFNPVISPLLLKRVNPSLFFGVSLVFISSFYPLHWKTAEGVNNNDAFWPENNLHSNEEWNETAVGIKSPSGAVVGKLFGLMSKVVGDVGNEVKNSVLYGMSKLRTSEKYKKAKYLISAPPVDTKWVSARLQIWGTETLKFAQAYACMLPETRIALLKLSAGDSPHFTKMSRKYMHLGELPDADGCYKNLNALKGALEETLERVRVRTKVQQSRPASLTAPYDLPSAQFTPAGIPLKDEEKPTAAFEIPMYDSFADLEIRRAAQLIQLVIKTLPRILFYLVHPFANAKTLANELAFYLNKMVPIAKQVFALTWRLNSILPAGSSLANKRMMTDYLEDALEFETGLHALLEMRKGYPCEYNPHDDYYFVPPPSPAVLEAPPLTDSV